MISRILTHRDRIEGWILLLSLLTASLFVLAPRTYQVFSHWQSIQHNEALIRSHSKDLSRPIPVNPYNHMRSYISDVKTPEAYSNLSSQIQAALLDLVRSKQARLTDLRESPSDRSIGGLEALQFKLEAEGDIQSLLEVIDGIGGIEIPILVKTLELRPLGSADRPDQRMRLVITLSAWTGNT
ncbi:hypothetical protein HY29_17930 [Hyphomonas beringensis]|uniref:General secretion pathway protein M n=1 Tax=Hyphomonas beringensis TaxID=1280946 RepID=A0A062TXM7_9PROT|nr:hypothetical protein HY29_17930 [Hyphomonas beringensis]